MRKGQSSHPFLDMLPEPHKDTFALEPEEFGGLLLEYLNSGDTNEGSQFWSDNLGGDNNLLINIRNQTGQELPPALKTAALEAWSWLEREGLIVKNPGGGWLITRRGKKLTTRDLVASMKAASVLPRGLLHASMLAKVWPSFLHGEYETAVFAAFKEVEIAVRTASKLSATDVGTKLMRKAFDANSGPLRDTDPNTAADEKEGLAHLFAGSMSYYRNPFGHHHVAATAAEAAKMIVFADHLMDIVESRS